MAKTKGKKLPKKIAGVKLPKELRKSGNSLLALVNQPVAREIAIAAALAAISASKDAKKMARKAQLEAGGEADEALGKVDWLTPALSAAAAEAGRRLFQAYREQKAGAGEAGSASTKTAKVIRLVETLAASRKG